MAYTESTFKKGYVVSDQIADAINAGDENTVVETLARELHEAGREAVEKGLIVRKDVPTKGFIEWDELEEGAREGRRVQARYLYQRFVFTPLLLKVEREGFTVAPEPSVGRMVHYVSEQHGHRAAIITAVPGQVVTALPDTVREPFREDAPLDSGIVSLSVFTAPKDDDQSDYARQAAPTLVRFAGVPYDPTGTKPRTWHWPERVG